MHRTYPLNNNALPSPKERAYLFGTLSKAESINNSSHQLMQCKLSAKEIPIDLKIEIVKLAQSFDQLYNAMQKKRHSSKKMMHDAYFHASFDLAKTLIANLIQAVRTKHHHNLIPDLKKIMSLLRVENQIALYEVASYKYFRTFFDVHKDNKDKYLALFDECLLRLEDTNQISFFDSKVFETFPKLDQKKKNAQLALAAIIISSLAVTIALICISAPFFIPLILAGISAILLTGIAIDRRQNDKILNLHKSGELSYKKSVAFFNQGTSTPISTKIEYKQIRENRTRSTHMSISFTCSCNDND